MLNSKIPSRGIFAAPPFLITHPEGISRIKGTRISVSVILEHIADGQSGDDLLEGYQELTRGDIQTALFYAGSYLDHSEIRAVGA